STHRRRDGWAAADRLSTLPSAHRNPRNKIERPSLVCKTTDFSHVDRRRRSNVRRCKRGRSTRRDRRKYQSGKCGERELRQFLRTESLARATRNPSRVWSLERPRICRQRLEPGRICHSNCFLIGHSRLHSVLASRSALSKKGG